MTAPVIRKGFAGPVGEHPLVKLVISGMRTKAKIYRNNQRLFAGDVAFCPRKAVMYHKIDPDLEVETSASGKLYMGIGSAVHEQVTTSLYEQGMLLFKEYRIPNLSLGLGGYVDAIIWLNDRVRGVEIKTCGKLPDAIKPEHRQQAMTYQAVTGIKMCVMYVSRNVADYSGKIQMRVFELDATQEQLDNALASVAVAYFFSEAGVLPRIPAHITSEKDCTFCPFQSVCWKGAEAPVPLPTAEVREALMAKVTNRVAELKAEAQNRTNGVLQHISLHGTKYAAEKLGGKDWSTIL